MNYGCFIKMLIHFQEAPQGRIGCSGGDVTRARDSYRRG